MKQTIKKNFLTGSILLVAAVLFLSLNVLSGRLFKPLRLDLTQNKLYTLSAGSKEIVAGIKEPIILRFYFSKSLANINPYLTSFATRVEDLLQQYQRASKNKILLEIIDPKPFSAAEDEAVNYGLQGAPVDAKGTEFYLGLVGTDALNHKRVIPFLQPNREQNLEYDISQLIYMLINPQPRVVGVMSALPIAGGYNSRPWAIWQQMEQLFALKILDHKSGEIPAEINTLMLVDVGAFSHEALTAIDAFIMRGGHVLAFVDPFTEVLDPRTSMPSPRHSKDPAYLRLLRAWGIEFDDKQVLADQELAKIVRAPYEGREVNVRYPLWMDFGAANFDTKDVLSSYLEKLTLATPGVLKQAENATTRFSPLVTSTDQAMLLPVDKVVAFQNDLQLFFNEYSPQGKHVVAARIAGPIASAFNDAKVADSNIIVVADTDMLHDHFWINIQNMMGQDIAVPSASNGNFIVSALDNLTGSNALISIRNRGTFARPFETIYKLELASQQKYRSSEQMLQHKLQATKQKLELLENQKREGNSVVLTDQQKKTAEAFRQELVETRKELREVRRKLNHEIESVATNIKLYTIGLIPLLIVGSGLVVWGIQIKREFKSRRAACSAAKH